MPFLKDCAPGGGGGTDTCETTAAGCVGTVLTPGGPVQVRSAPKHPFVSASSPDPLVTPIVVSQANTCGGVDAVPYLKTSADVCIQAGEGAEVQVQWFRDGVLIPASTSAVAIGVGAGPIRYCQPVHLTTYLPGVVVAAGATFAASITAVATVVAVGDGNNSVTVTNAHTELELVHV